MLNDLFIISILFIQKKIRIDRDNVLKERKDKMQKNMEREIGKWFEEKLG